MSSPTMAISCPYCRCWQRAPIPVAEGTDPWICVECGKAIELPRRNLRVPAEKPKSREEDE
jgi:DNA-directed RNA polymerase subunit RPC12/RpoP